MAKLFKRALRSVVRSRGYDIVPWLPSKAEEYPADFDNNAIELCKFVKPYTLTSPERLIALRNAVEYVLRCEIPGDVVECGVWRGGSMMAIARTLLIHGAQDRHLHLFDTFEGMSQPSKSDVDWRGESASSLMEHTEKGSGVWCHASLEDVQQNMNLTRYPSGLVHFVKGKVEETLPARAPDCIAVLRLDTDWRESTYHELVHLFPRLSPGGVLIIDDYGHWEGARKAVDQYLAEINFRPLLHRIDYTGRIAVKPTDSSERT